MSTSATRRSAHWRCHFASISAAEYRSVMAGESYPKGAALPGVTAGTRIG